jgi:arylsulfatase A-like enzyme
MFGGRGVPRGDSFNESDVLDKPRWVRNIPPLGGRQIEELDELYSSRLDSVQTLDEMVGRLFETLQATGRLANTYVIVTSDNGLLLGQHRVSGGKNSAYEESISVPLLVRGPGVPAGRRVPHIAGNIDIASTLLAIAGATPPSNLDGRSLLPVLSANPPAQAEWRKDILIESNGGFGGVAGEAGVGVRVPAYNAIRQASTDGEYVYVEYTGSNDRELYDLRNDPEQLANAINAVDPALVQRLSARVAALKDCRAESCRQ